MTEKHNRILAAALVLQVVIAIVVFWPSQPTAASGEPLFAELEVGDFASLTVTDGADGAAVVLSLMDGDWVLPAADDYPADETKVVALLAKIVALTSDRLVARTETSHARLGVADDDFVRRVDIQTQDGAEHAFLLVAGAGSGALAALVAIVPQLSQDASYLPLVAVPVILAGLLLAGALWVTLAARLALREPRPA